LGRKKFKRLILLKVKLKTTIRLLVLRELIKVVLQSMLVQKLAQQETVGEVFGKRLGSFDI
jgi:hypothetical protein